MKLISSTGSERATNDPAKIVVYENTMHLTWQDIDANGYQNYCASIDLSSGTISQPSHLDTGIDNHARSVITVDYEGYLHVIVGGHNSPVYHRRSLRPNDSSEWGEAKRVSSKGTYPVVLCDIHNTVYVQMRGRVDGVAAVEFFACESGQDWEKRSTLILNADTYSKFYAAYPTRMAVDTKGTIHVLSSVYEGNIELGRGYHQALCYSKSMDGGRNWLRANDTDVIEYARPENLDCLLQSSRPRVEATPPPELVPVGVTLNSRDHLQLFFLSHDQYPGDLFIAEFKEGCWQRRSIKTVLDNAYPEMRTKAAWVSIRSDDSICILVNLAPYNDDWINGKITRKMIMSEKTDERLLWLISTDGGETFSVETVLEPGVSFNNPSVEFPCGANRIDAFRKPFILYYDGTNAYPGGEEYYNKPIEEMLADGDYKTTNVWLIE